MPDNVTVKAEKGFLPCPEGTIQAVAVDVIDLGETMESYKNEPPQKKHKVAIVFQADELNPDTGKRFEPSIELTASFGRKANLRKFLGDWRGKPYTDEEAEGTGAPLHKLVGVNAILNIQHKTSVGAGRLYALIASISPPMKGMGKMTPLDYTRSAHWEKRKEDYCAKVLEAERAHLTPAAANAAEYPAPEDEDESDSLPF
jgi:hypothetical protein